MAFPTCPECGDTGQLACTYSLCPRRSLRPSAAAPGVGATAANMGVGTHNATHKQTSHPQNYASDRVGNN